MKYETRFHLYQKSIYHYSEQMSEIYNAQYNSCIPPYTKYVGQISE